jgi:hypothetical protein
MPKAKKVYTAAEINKAAKLSWVFPGAGHFASGRKGKGMFFTGLELAALAGVAVFGGNYATKGDEYNSAQLALEEYEADFLMGNNPDGSYEIYKQVTIDAFDAQKQALSGLIGCGAVSGVVWLWNIIDMKKIKSGNYSDNRLSMGINQHGQVEARISF